MSRRWLNTLFVLPLFLLASPLSAAEQWYDVELLVFSRDQRPSPRGEAWPANPLLPELAEVRELIPAAMADPNREPQAFVRLEGEALGFREEAQRLQKQGLQPLVHLGWRQPGLARDQSVAVRIRAAAANQPGGVAETQSGGTEEPAIAEEVLLDGSVRLVLSRYLHLEADLAYFDPPRRAPLATDPAEPADPQPEEAQTTTYRLVDSRRMRSREIHYLDHPAFGIIAMVTPYEAEKKPVATPAVVPAPKPTAVVPKPHASTIQPAPGTATNSGAIRR